MAFFNGSRMRLRSKTLEQYVNIYYKNRMKKLFDMAVRNKPLDSLRFHWSRFDMRPTLDRLNELVVLINRVDPENTDTKPLAARAHEQILRFETAKFDGYTRNKTDRLLRSFDALIKRVQMGVDASIRSTGAMIRELEEDIGLLEKREDNASRFSTEEWLDTLRTEITTKRREHDEIALPAYQEARAKFDTLQEYASEVKRLKGHFTTIRKLAERQHDRWKQNLDKWENKQPDGQTDPLAPHAHPAPTSEAE